MNYGIVAAARTTVTEAIPDIDYETGAVHFDGSAYLSRGATLTGWGTPSKFTSVVWIKLSSCEDGIFSDANYFTQGTTADGANRYINANVANAYCESLGQITSAGWQCFLLSMDLTDAPTEVPFSLYLGDSDTLGSSSHGSASSTIAAGSDFFFGQDGLGVKITGDVADFRLWLGSAVDFSIVSNRRLFIRSNGKPADPTLATAVLGTPIVSFIASKADPTGTFVANGGTGGSFTLTGSLTATLSPTDSALDGRSSFAGAGTFSANGSLLNPIAQGTALFTGVGNLSVGGDLSNPMQQQGTASFAGAGNLSVNIDNSETLAWAAAVVSAGGTVSSARRNLITNLISGLKADGLWSKLDRLWLFAAENSQSALIDLVSTSTASLVATNPTFTADEGYTGNASGYIDTNFNATSGTPKFTQNDGHWSMWNLNGDAVSGNTGFCGNGGTGGAQWSYFSSVHYQFLNDGSGTGTLTIPSLVGHHMVSRSSSTQRKHYHDGSSILTSTSTSGAPLNATFVVLYDRTTNAKSVMQAAAFSIGSNLNGGSDASNFYNRLHTYMTAIGL